MRRPEHPRVVCSARSCLAPQRLQLLCEQRQRFGVLAGVHVRVREHPERVQQIRVVRLRDLPKGRQRLPAEVDSVGVLGVLVERVRVVEGGAQLLVERPVRPMLQLLCQLKPSLRKV
eukprot:COSAG03_NODE_639_length_6562_cov_16.796844_9_plen_117_part_00